MMSVAQLRDRLDRIHQVATDSNVPSGLARLQIAEMSAPTTGEAMNALDLINQFTKLGAGGAVLPTDAAEFLIVHQEICTPDGKPVLARDWIATEIDDSVDFAGAEAYVAKLNAEQFGGYSDWQLPSLQSLQSIADIEKVGPAIDKTFFPNCQSDRYWTSTADAESPSGYAWFVNFGYGDSNWGYRSRNAFVRAVRPSQLLSLGLQP